MISFENSWQPNQLLTGKQPTTTSPTAHITAPYLASYHPDPSALSGELSDVTLVQEVNGQPGAHKVHLSSGGTILGPSFITITGTCHLCGKCFIIIYKEEKKTPLLPDEGSGDTVKDGEVSSGIHHIRS